MTDAWFLLDGVNPEPWEAPEVSIGRKGSGYFPRFHSPPKYTTYHAIVQEEFDARYGDFDCLVNTPLVVEFAFWREVSEYDTPTGRKGHSNYADTSNLTKGTEDALQGRIYDNDANNRIVSGVIVEQGPDVSPAVLVHIRSLDLERDLLELIIKRGELSQVSLDIDSNVLPKERGADGLF
jgi:Holliday junction resolvase RusA-like endonuclease